MKPSLVLSLVFALFMFGGCGSNEPATPPELSVDEEQQILDEVEKAGTGEASQLPNDS